MRSRTLAVGFVLVMSSLLQAAVQATFYVSPTGTGDYSVASPGSLSGIIAKVRSVNTAMAGDIVVALKGGRYELASTFALTAADGGTGGHNVIYQAAPGEVPVISGGVKVTGAWSVADAAKNIYKTNVGTAVAAARQLYVNSTRAVRARSVDGSGWSLSGSSFTCPSAAASWKNPTSVEIVAVSQWRVYRLNVKSISGTTAQVQTMFGQSWAPMTDPQWVENAYELLDAPGEWWMDRTNGDLFYKPRAGEDVTTAEVVVPNLQSLLTLTSVSNVQFNGITFCHNSWLAPNTSGINADQGDGLLPSGQNYVAVGMTLDHCKNVRFSENTIEHMGSTSMGLVLGTSNCTVFKNVFRDISGSAIRVGTSALNPAAADQITDDSICNNLIRDCAVEFGNCCGVFVYFANHLVVNHNEIRNIGYTGISYGWDWAIPGRPSMAKNYDCAYNYIDSIMVWPGINDGGGIYTLGAIPGTTIRDNYIRHQFQLFGNLYLDGSTTGCLMDSNVLTDGVYWAMLKGPNTVKDNWICTMQNGADPVDQSNGEIITSNNNCYDNCVFPAAAQTVIKNAGRVNVPTQSVGQAIRSDDGGRKMTIGNGVSISIPRGAKEVTCSILSASGRLVRQSSPAAGSALRKTGEAALPAGVYYVKVGCITAEGFNSSTMSRFMVR